MTIHITHVYFAPLALGLHLYTTRSPLPLRWRGQDAIPSHSRKQGAANETWHVIWFMGMHGWWWVTRGDEAWWNNCPTGGQICGAADDNVAEWLRYWGGQGVWTMLSRDDGAVGTSTICPESAVRTGPATSIGVWIGHHAWADGLQPSLGLVRGDPGMVFGRTLEWWEVPSSNIDIP
ncbi:hypothetical protein BD779DRAFT_1466610 [Infundibulicybe gibba]|nr:hypothetical protein BD779DRAFT_1466610 [Infundibulicybe gibba]